MYHFQHDQGLNALVFRRWRTMGIAFSLFLAAGVGILGVMPHQYQSSAKLMVMRGEQRLGGIRIGIDTLPELTGASHPLYTQVELIRITPVLNDVIKEMDLRDAEGNRVRPEALASKIRVTPIKDTDIIEVSYVDSDPILAQRLVRTLCNSYITYTRKYRQEGAKEGLQYLDQQIGQARKQLAKSENALQAYKRQNGTVALSTEIDVSLREHSDLDQLVHQHHMNLESAQARARSIRSQLGMSAKEALTAAAISQSPKVRYLQEQLITAEASPIMTMGLTENHPEMVALSKRINLLKKEMGTEIGSMLGNKQTRTLDDVQIGLLQQLTSAETDILTAKASLSAAKSGMGRIQGILKNYPEQEIKLARLMREVSVASTMYQQLLEKQSEARLNSNSIPAYSCIIQPATLPLNPRFPQNDQALPVLLLGSIVAAFGAGTLKDVTDQSVDPSELGSYLPKSKLLIQVPAIEPKEITKGNPAAQHYLEALKSLGIALEDHLEGPSRMVGLTSLMPGDGKSVTITNLATCLSEMGHRVLVVDGDFHQPHLQKMYSGDKASAGLSGVLQDHISPEEAVTHHEKFDLVQVGKGNQTISASSFKQRLRPALETWKSQYDFVLIDLPSISLLSMVVPFARCCDGVLVLANLQKITWKRLENALSQLSTVKLPILGMVAIAQHSKAPKDYYLPHGGKK